MELLVSVVIIFIVTFAIFGIVDMIRQINKVDIDAKPKTPAHIDNELESQKKYNVGDIDFMYKWIRQKSGK
jgi:hypothetical protein